MLLYFKGKSSAPARLYYRIILILYHVECGKYLPALRNLIQVCPLSVGWHLQSSALLKSDGQTLSLPGADSKNWYPVNVPSTVLAALVNNKVYPDPYYSDNLKSIPGYREDRWLAMKKDSPFYPAWWYRTEFDLPPSWQKKFITLHLDGINYKANIWMNGHQVADTSNVIGMFRRFTFDVSDIIVDGQKNVLAVEVFAPGRIADIPYRTKQVEATTGWDDHNPPATGFKYGLMAGMSI